jgi:CheY-like chemotaxis protein
MKILLVEDHDDTRCVLTRLLDRYGHSVISAATVTDARRLLRDRQFDVLLSEAAAAAQGCCPHRVG